MIEPSGAAILICPYKDTGRRSTCPETENEKKNWKNLKNDEKVM